MRGVRSHPTAGQATLEYIAAVALVAALLLAAAPAVGAPDIARAVAAAVKHGLCVAGGDVCSTGDARRAGLPPCPLKSDFTGAEGSVKAFSVELGGKWTLTVTPRSDGSVAIVRAAGGSVGVSAGAGPSGSLGPMQFQAGADGALKARVVAARGWVLPDAATAKRFLEHSLEHSFDDGAWPPAWRSAELGGETSGSLGVSAGDTGGNGDGKVVGATVGAGSTIGWRWAADGSTTRYSRFNVDGTEVAVAFLPSLWAAGKAEWVSEYTRGPHGEPRELVLRTALSRSHRITESIAHLDLTDPANLAIARPFLDTPMPRSFPFGAARQALLDRIATHGVVERLVSDVHDDSLGASIDFKAGLEFGLGGKKLAVHRTLTEASVRRGALTGRRLDCVPAPG